MDQKSRVEWITAFDYMTTFGVLWIIKDIDYKTLLDSNPNDSELRRIVKVVSIVKIVSVITVVLFAINITVLKILE